MIEWIFDMGRAYAHLNNLRNQIDKDEICKEKIIFEIETILALMEDSQIQKTWGEIHFGPGP
jgi:hypothetical protein